jgi:Putative motility protein
MDPVSNATARASSADLATVQGSASMLVLRKALDHQAASAAQLIAALPQPALAASGSVGTRLDAWA